MEYMKKEEKKTTCVECGGRGGGILEEHDFERCDVCLGEGCWQEEENDN